MSQLRGVTKKNGCLIIGLPDTISMDNCYVIEKEVDRLLDDDVKKIAFDVGGVENLYSCAMGMMIRFHRKTAERGGAVCLVNVSSKVRKVLETVNLDRVFALYATDVEFELFEDGFSLGSESDSAGRFMCFSQLENGVVHISLSGPMNETQDLSDCNTGMYEPGVGKYVIDMSGLEMIDSSGAQSLTAIIEELQKNSGTCVGFGASSEIQDFLTMLAVDLPMYPSETEAIKALTK